MINRQPETPTLPLLDNNTTIVKHDTSKLVADFEKENLNDNIKLAFQQAEHERQFLINRVTIRKAKSDKHQGKSEESCNIKTTKANHIKKLSENNLKILIVNSQILKS